MTLMGLFMLRSLLGIMRLQWKTHGIPYPPFAAAADSVLDRISGGLRWKTSAMNRSSRRPGHISLNTKIKTKNLLTGRVRLPSLRPVRAVKNQYRNPLLFRKKVERVGFLSFYESGLNINFLDAHVAQLVEHVLGKDEVISSILIMGSS